MSPFFRYSLSPEVKLLRLAYRKQKVFLMASDVLRRQRERDRDCMSGLCSSSRQALYEYFHTVPNIVSAAFLSLLPIIKFLKLKLF
jgi:hypothetical protein